MFLPPSDWATINVLLVTTPSGALAVEKPNKKGETHVPCTWNSKGGRNLYQMAGGKYDGEKLMTLFQAWKLSEDDKKLLELKGVDWVEKPLIQIEFSVSRKPRSAGQNKGRGRGGRHGRGGQLKSGASSIESSSTGSQGSNWRGARWRGRGRQ